jgi:hypothetical protein
MLIEEDNWKAICGRLHIRFDKGSGDRAFGHYASSLLYRHQQGVRLVYRNLIIEGLIFAFSNARGKLG